MVAGAAVTMRRSVTVLIAMLLLVLLTSCGGPDIATANTSGTWGASSWDAARWE